MKHKTLLLLITLFLGITVGCKEYQEIYQKNKALYDYYKKQAQTFKLSLDNGGMIVGEEGTKIFFPKHTLETVSGKNIVGAVDIKLTEYYKTEDIILANLSTTSNNKLLETGGMINLEATNNGEEVKVKKGQSFQIEFADYKKGMEIFEGEMEDGHLNWVSKEKPGQVNQFGFFGQYQTAAGQRQSIFGSKLLSNQFNWINCDRFLKLNNLTKVTVKHNVNFQPELYLAFENMNSLIWCRSDNFSNIPIGYKATVLAFYVEEEYDEQVYFFAKEIVVEKDMEVAIDFKQIPLAQLKAEIKKRSYKQK